MDLGYLTKPDYSKIADELSQIRKMVELSAKESERRSQRLSAKC